MPDDEKKNVTGRKKVSIKQNKSKTIYFCNDCDYNGSYAAYRYHTKYEHEGIRYPCDQCNHVATRNSNLTAHKNAKHSSKFMRTKNKTFVKYPCDQCDYVGSQSALIQHRKSDHEGIRYPCDQCQYTATSSGNLKIHINAIHKGIKLPCDHCAYAATRPSDLTRHVKAKHRITSYPCDQCEYEGVSPLKLKKHRERKHSKNYKSRDIQNLNVQNIIKTATKSRVNCESFSSFLEKYKVIIDTNNCNVVFRIFFIETQARIVHI